MEFMLNDWRQTFISIKAELMDLEAFKLLFTESTKIWDGKEIRAREGVNRTWIEFEEMKKREEKEKRAINDAVDKRQARRFAVGYRTSSLPFMRTGGCVFKTDGQFRISSNSFS